MSPIVVKPKPSLVYNNPRKLDVLLSRPAARIVQFVHVTKFITANGPSKPGSNLAQRAQRQRRFCICRALEPTTTPVTKRYSRVTGSKLMRPGFNGSSVPSSAFLFQFFSLSSR